MNHLLSSNYAKTVVKSAKTSKYGYIYLYYYLYYILLH